METQADEAQKVHHGHNVRMVRTWNKMSQVVLADLLECSQDKISKLERQQTIDDAILEKIALALNVDMDYLKEDHSPFGVTNNSINESTITQTVNAAENSEDTLSNNVAAEQSITYNISSDTVNDLYERLLKSEVENAQLKSKVKDLTKENHKLKGNKGK